MMTMTEPVRRIEVFTGSGRRRSWSADDKARIVAESLTCGQSVSETARRHGLSASQLFAWRRQARELTGGGTETPAFVPAIVDVPKTAPEKAIHALVRGASPLVPMIELNGVEPHAYLANVITKIVNGHSNSQIDNLLPWAYAQTFGLKSVA